MTLLLAEEMVGGYGGADVLQGCSLTAARGQIAVVVGPNGAGKSTALRAVAGLLPLRAGRVGFGGRDITRLAPQARVPLGMALVPQADNVFAGLTVAENLEMGGYVHSGNGAGPIAEVTDLFPALLARRQQPAGALSGGLRQQVAIGRALMARPSLLLLDEPTAGLAPLVMSQLFERIVEIAAAGVAILIVEQNARQALAIADTGFVLVQGRVRFQGPGPALLADPDVRRAFLGG